MLLGVVAKAQTVRVVDNNPGSIAAYTTVQAAIDAAVDGDIIQIKGSSTSYGDVTLNKTLTLVGNGYNPNKQNNLKTELGSIILDGKKDQFNNITNTASGSKISGIYIWSIYNNLNNASGLDNLTIENNYIMGTITIDGVSNSNPASNWLIKNNIIGAINTSINTSGANVFSNIVISNNIIKSTMTFISGYYGGVIFTNNIFTYSGTLFFSGVSYIPTNLTFSNNILFGVSPNACTSSTFNNNISIGGSSTTFTFSNNTSLGNKENVNPLFVNAPSSTFSYSYDYNLQATSPGKNAGTDGTDIGIYGGLYPFPSGGVSPYVTSPLPKIPQIMEMNLINSVLPANGTLQVQIKATNP